MKYLIRKHLLRQNKTWWIRIYLVITIKTQLTQQTKCKLISSLSSQVIRIKEMKGTVRRQIPKE